MNGKNVNLHWKSSKFSLALQPEALVNTSGRVDFSSPAQDTPRRPNMHYQHALLVKLCMFIQKNIIDPKYYLHYHLDNIIVVESSSISGVFTAEKTPQAQPQDSLKFASRYLDGDSNFKI